MGSKFLDPAERQRLHDRIDRQPDWGQRAVAGHLFRMSLPLLLLLVLALALWRGVA